jgi:hypothetical protein
MFPLTVSIIRAAVIAGVWKTGDAILHDAPVEQQPHFAFLSVTLVAFVVLEVVRGFRAMPGPSRVSEGYWVALHGTALIVFFAAALVGGFLFEITRGTLTDYGVVRALLASVWHAGSVAALVSGSSIPARLASKKQPERRDA